MVARGPGAVGCAHCSVIGADRACQVCTRLVCPACAADWATCAEPSGRVVRLGATARVRDIDPLGRSALVSHWRQPLRVFDLRRLRFIDGIELPRRLHLISRRFPPRLTSDGRVIQAEVSAADNYDMWFYGFKSRSLLDGSTTTIDGAKFSPEHSTAVSAHRDTFSYVSVTQQVVVVVTLPSEALPESSSTVMLERPPGSPPLRTRANAYEPLPRKVVHAAHVDAERDLLAAGSWSELSLHRMAGDTLERLGHIKTDRQGDVRFIACAGPYLVAAILDMAVGVYVEVRRLEHDLSIGPVVHRFGPERKFETAAISRDGRHLAAAFADRLHVYDLDTGTTTVFDDHSDTINAVRFAADDHVLISADTDNRVILRPRTDAGYARVLIPIAL